MSQEKRVRTFVSISQKICMFMWLWYNIATSFATNSRSVDCLTVLKIWLQILTLLQAAFVLFDLSASSHSFNTRLFFPVARKKKKIVTPTCLVHVDSYDHWLSSAQPSNIKQIPISVNILGPWRHYKARPLENRILRIWVISISSKYICDELGWGGFVAITLQWCGCNIWFDTHVNVQT